MLWNPAPREALGSAQSLSLRVRPTRLGVRASAAKLLQVHPGGQGGRARLVTEEAFQGRGREAQRNWQKPRGAVALTSREMGQP